MSCLKLHIGYLLLFLFSVRVVVAIKRGQALSNFEIHAVPVERVHLDLQLSW